jgi:hypothetical protein
MIIIEFISKDFKTAIRFLILMAVQTEDKVRG